MSDSIRQQKVASLLQKELAVIFQQESRNLFKGALITVTVVRMAPDLGFAKVYLSFFMTEVYPWQSGWKTITYCSRTSIL